MEPPLTFFFVFSTKEKETGRGGRSRLPRLVCAPCNRDGSQRIEDIRDDGRAEAEAGRAKIPNHSLARAISPLLADSGVRGNRYAGIRCNLSSVEINLIKRVSGGT